MVILTALGSTLVAMGFTGVGGPLTLALARAAASILAVAIGKLVWPVVWSLISVVAMVVGVPWILLWAGRAEEKGAQRRTRK